MKITFASPYKSVLAFPAIEVPDFVILTGVNGAGKSHFLQALENGALRINAPPSPAGGTPPHMRAMPPYGNVPGVRRFDWTNLSPQDGGAFAGFQTRQERSSYWTQLLPLRAPFHAQIYQAVSEIPELSKLSVKKLVALKAESLVSNRVSIDDANRIVSQIQAVAMNGSEQMAQQFLQADPVNRKRLVDGIRAAAEFPLVALEEEDFYDSFPPTWQPVDMFQQSFARLFVEYQDNWRNNQLKRWQNSLGENYKVLSDADFVKRFGEPPWDFVNSIFKTASLDFRINSPDPIEDRPFDPTLEDTITGAKVKFGDLSSGEKVLMSFALCLYYGKDDRQIVGYPEVILFDEIDAPLHPSMTQSLLRTIQDVLVNQRKIKVIFTTHSPTTVALAPETAIYVMNKNGVARLEKTSKDRALAVLMAGVPTLSMSYENRRQVFVESSYDVSYYGKLYERLKPKLVPEISLNFIASGNSGGCALVRDIVSQLQGAGNNSVFGIVDWDLSNKRSSNVCVLGVEQRYSIENFILDPLLLSVLLFMERIVTRDQIGLQAGETHIDFGRFSDERLQTAANFVVERVRPQLKDTENSDSTSCRFVGGQQISIPQWYCLAQGHALEGAIRSTFPQLKAFHGESKLKNAILDRVLDDLPMLVPTAFHDLFSEIQVG